MANATKRTYGPGTIYQRKDGRWVAAVQLPSSPNAPRKRKTFTGATRSVVVAKLAEWRAQHPAPEFLGRAEYLRLAREKGTHKPSEWYALFRKVKGRCYYCKIETDFITTPRLDPRHTEKDHLIPVSRGGSDAIENIVVSCRRCNMEKSTMTAAEYRAWKKATA